MRVHTLKISQDELDTALEPLLRGTKTIEEWLQEEKNRAQNDNDNPQQATHDKPL